MSFARTISTFVCLSLCGWLQAQPGVMKQDAYHHGLARVHVEKRPRFVREDDDHEPLPQKFGLIDKQGKLIADTIYDYAGDVKDDGMVVLVKDGRIGVMDSTGRFISRFIYRTDLLYWPQPAFHDGLLPVLSQHSAGDRWNATPLVGFMDRKGRLVIDTVYDPSAASGNRIADFNRMKMAGGMCGTGMHRGSVFAHEHPYYLRAGFYEFEGDRCLVVRDGKNIVIDKKGRELYTIPGYIQTASSTSGYFQIDTARPYEPYIDRQLGGDLTVPSPFVYYDRAGKVIVPLPNTQIVLLWRGHLVVRTADNEYQLADPVTQWPEPGRSFKYISVRMDGGLNTDKGTLER